MDTGPPDPLAHLRQARRDLEVALAWVDDQLRTLLESRNVLRARLEDLDQLIDKFGVSLPDLGIDYVLTGSGKTTALVEAKRHPSAGFDPSDSSASTRTAILHLLETEDRPFETHEIVEGVQRLGIDSQPATTRSLLSKMADSGEIERVRRGLYRHGKGSIVDPAAGSGAFLRRSLRVVDLRNQEGLTQEQLIAIADGDPSPNELREAGVHGLTPEEFMAMRSDEDEPDYDPSEHDKLTHDDYVAMAREATQAHREEQADREENRS